MTTHTPGPWHISDETNPLITNDSGSVDVAQVFMYDEGTFGSLRPNAYADARLIAAAPDLLEALRAWTYKNNAGLPYEERLRRTFAAIARATGEA